VIDIADFLRARYAEQRAIAHAAASLQYDPENGWGILDSSGYASTEKRRWISPHIGMLHESESAEHVVANNPAVVLADLDAKLALVERCDEWVAYGPVSDSDVDRAGDGSFVDAGTIVLRLLAQPFAGHPDHKGEEWAP